MQHTAIIGAGLPPVQITFNCSDPSKSVTGTYGPGTTTDPDDCVTIFVSATVGGATVNVGSTVDVTIQGIACRATASTEDQGRHVTVQIEISK